MVRKSDYGPIPDDHYRSPNMKEILNIVATRGDLQRIISLLNKTPDNRRAIFMEFCTNIMEEHIYDYEFRYARPFLRRIFSLEVFSLETLKCLEKVLINADYEAVAIFLKMDFYAEVRAKHNYDIVACLFGNNDFFDYPMILKDEIIDVNGRGYNGKTPLHFAVQHSIFSYTRRLLRRGANPNAVDDKGRTPLSLAMYSKNGMSSRCVEVLLLAGADPLLVKDRYKEIVEDHVWNSWYFEKIKQLVVAQLMIYEENGRLNEENEGIFRLWYDRESAIYADRCRRQLEKLKDEKISDTCELTMFSVIAERPKKIVRYLDVKDVTAIITYNECNGGYFMPYYRDLLQKHVDGIVRLENLECWRNRALQYVCQLTGIDDPNHLVVNKIVSYLSAKDLQKFSFARSKKQWSLKTVAKSLMRVAKQFVCRPIET